MACRSTITAGRPISAPIERNTYADAFFANTGAIVRHGGTSAFYDPSSDHIQMPPIESFRDAQSYVAVRAHETRSSRRANESSALASVWLLL